MFIGTLAQWVSELRDGLNQRVFGVVMFPVVDRFSTVALTSAGLVIKAGGSALVKTGSAATYAYAKSVLQKVAGSTDMPALAGTVTNGTFNCFAFFIDNAGTVTSQIGIAGATLAAMQLPTLPKHKALLGFVIINPTGTGDFVGGTTALDDGTVAPNAAYINTPLGFDPQCQTGPAPGPY